MNFASLELSKELYELSGWDDPEDWWTEQGNKGFAGVAPMYDLGYLVAKLPPSIKIELSKRVYYDDDNHWSVDLTAWLGDSFYMTDDFKNNEDAVATLVIMLLKDGNLKPAVKNNV